MPSRPPKLTRTHATAVLLHARKAGSAVLIVHEDGRIEITGAAAFMDGGTGRAMIWNTDLEESGAHLAANGSGSLAPGSGAIVDLIIDDANTHLATTWRTQP